MIFAASLPINIAIIFAYWIGELPLQNLLILGALEAVTTSSLILIALLRAMVKEPCEKCFRYPIRLILVVIAICYVSMLITFAYSFLSCVIIMVGLTIKIIMLGKIKW